MPRRPRLSQAQTEERMLAAALDQVNAAGLTVSLEHLSYEAVIAAADVSRAAAYRRWPSKESFLRDLVRELARATRPRALVLAETSLPVIREILLSDPERLSDPEHRRRLVAEVFRRATDLDFQRMFASVEWRTYLALHATFASLPDAALRADVQRGLAAAQDRFVASMAANWAQLAPLLGFRLTSANLGFDALAVLVSAGVRGLLVMAMADPSLAARRIDADPFGTGMASWSLAAFSCASVAATFFEPVPGLTWDESHTAALRAGLVELPAE